MRDVFCRVPFRPGRIMCRLLGAPLLSLALLARFAIAAFAGDLALPVACDIGRTCFIQNYMDIDPSHAAKDFMCGTLTYEGHNGIDFRLPSLVGQQVPVLAAAAGEVLRTRDGVPDVLVNDRGRSKVDGSECGNGVVVKHEGDRETQYCHLAKGSIRVKPGDMVIAGHILGDIGLSGLTEYPHLHFILRRSGKVIDPFADGRVPGECGGSATSHWQAPVQAQLVYSPRTLLNFGFTTIPVSNEAVETGETTRRQPTIASEAIVAFVRAIGLKSGDVQLLTMRDPAGQVIAENRSAPLASNKAQVVLYTGRKRLEGNWDRGRYTATYAISSDGQTLFTKQFEADMH
jgi:hypothetical protein